MHSIDTGLHNPYTVFHSGVFQSTIKHLTLPEGLNMNTISKFKISFIAFISLNSSSVFAGIAPPVAVSEPSVLALIGAGAVVMLYLAKTRKK